MLKNKTIFLALKSVITRRNPFYVQFALSKYCNLNCKMCQAVESRKDDQELGLNEIEELAGILSKIGAVFLILTGGEPLLREDLVEIVKIFTMKGISVRLQTNGIGIYAEKIKLLVKAGLKNVTISLESLFPENQDLITGKQGSWYEIMKGISLFSQYLPTRGSFCGINIVVTKFNLGELTHLVRFVTKIGFYVSLIPIHLSENKQRFIVRGNNASFTFNETDYNKIDQIYSELIGLKKRGYKIYNSLRFLKESPDFLKYKKIYWRCHSPYLYFSISPDGNFLPCVDIKMEEPMLGNRDFLKRYYSKEFKEKVRDAVKGCGGCMYGCWPEVSYLYDDFSVFILRILEGVKIQLSNRKAVDFHEILKLANEFRNEKNNSAF